MAKDKAPVEFWFDYVSPYSYFAAWKIEGIALQYGRSVVFKPFLLGAVFPLSGSAPLVNQYEPKARYSKHDFERSARFAGLPFTFPSTFPMLTQNIARTTIWMNDHAPGKVPAFAKGAMRAYFTESAPINDPAWIGAFAAELGVDGAAAAAACADPVYKDRLKAQTEAAIAQGTFGSPWIVVEGEHFWGNDRLPQVEWWLHELEEH
ncbi:hypothetical protein IP84_03785 [beta proteobacterium AAP99]|nr:hypothetical protein IP84_03785 [beta proteobacterium AAP99]